MDEVRRVPFLDLKSQIEPIRSEIDDAIADCINASDFILGPRLEAFEHAFADHCNVKHAIGVSSGTDALFLILRALGIGPGDEVITVANMFVAAVEAIEYTGATPVFVDVSEDTYCIDPGAVEAAITERTKAVVPVHLFGLPADMDPLLDVAKRHGLKVIEDACQAHGATYKGRRAGSLGHAAAFSFYPTKNLGGMGDGGAVTTNDTALTEKVRMLRHHAQPEKNTHAELGYNCRLDCIQAVVLGVKLRYLDEWNERRRKVASLYRSGLEGAGYTFQRIPDGVESVYHIVAIRHPHRQLVLEQLNQQSIGWGNHIARPIYLQPGYRKLGYEPGAFPVTEKLCDELVSLPISHTVTTDEARYVVSALQKVSVSV